LTRLGRRTGCPRSNVAQICNTRSRHRIDGDHALETLHSAPPHSASKRRASAVPRPRRVAVAPCRVLRPRPGPALRRLGRASPACGEGVAEI
jgi:hypothetical protein